MSPSPVACLVKQRLLRDFQDATRKVVDLDNKDVEFVLASDWKSSQALEAELKVAREARDAAALALRNHMQEHGC